MSAFLWNVVLAFLWAAMLDEITPTNLAIGFGVGLLLLAFSTTQQGASPYAMKLLYVGHLLALIFWNVLTANWRLAHEILTPGVNNQPAIYAYEMEARTDMEVTLLALIVSFAPGSLGLDVSQDRRLLYVHVMFTTTREQFTRNLREQVERPLLKVLR
ncbi:Na+/H+ antiporter subunit E [Archangium lansingense]|uniref:Na+/H+ antiporter subunit E n=1 Tax=Archangium lansingense TaxID=2995310 RepID=A0ABT4AHR4_9BACT|nr:Na+/H+ antiporter subunit E [Archangium lansinium]MCY1081228.1 Na+/H+ antiporter subunit E [Archangium lansinium]